MTTPSLTARQLSRISRAVASSALTIELAAERGDWEKVHEQHEIIKDLFEEYRAAYKRLLIERVGRTR